MCGKAQERVSLRPAKAEVGGDLPADARDASRRSSGRPGGGGPRVEVVIARCGEDLRWTRRLPSDVAVTVYDKSERPLPGALQLPNLGREGHTYLHHIVARFDSLADITVFAQGHPFDHVHDFHPTVRAIAEGRMPVGGFRWLGFIIDTDDPRGRRLFTAWSKNPEGRELPLEEFHQALFQSSAPPQVRFRPGAHFSVTRERIRFRSREFYVKARDLCLRWPGLEGAACLERIWDRLFGVRGVASCELDGRDTVYLKPIRRLGTMA